MNGVEAIAIAVKDAYARWGQSGSFANLSAAYGEPPVSETSLVVQFAPLKNWKVNLFGLFHATIEDRYPSFDAAPPILIKGSPLSIGFNAAPPVRGLYMNAERDRLLQVQSDLFCMNWRKSHLQSDYPRYETLRRDFIIEWDHFFNFLKQRDIEVEQIAGYQVTYVNVVDASSGLQLEDVCAVWKSGSDADVPRMLRHQTGLSLSASFDVEGVQLTYAVQPAIRIEDKAPVTQFTFTAAISGSDPSGGDFLVRLDKAHEVLIRGFEELTSARAKSVWKRS